MPRTAPGPNAIAIPGMNPGAFVAGGGGDGGGGQGKGGGGNGDKKGASGNSGEEDAEGGGQGAGDCGVGGPGGCTSCSDSAARGDPVNVADGEVFTIARDDVELPGFFELRIRRSYSSRLTRRNVGFGFGWAHGLAWTLEKKRREVLVTNGFGASASFPVDQASGRVRFSQGGWVLEEVDGGYILDCDDGFWHFFAPSHPGSLHYVLTRVESATHHALELRYDQGRLVEVIDTAGRTIELRRNGAGLIQTMLCRAPASGEVLVFGEYEYDAAERLISFTDPDGHVTRFEYVGAALLSKVEYPTGLAVHYLYDRQGRCVESWCDYGERPDPALADDLPAHLPGGLTRARGAHHILLEFGEEGYSEVTDSVRTQRYFTNEHGRLEKAVGNGGVTSRTFDSLGNMTSHTNASEATTHYEWDIRGRLLKQTDALGHSYVIERDIFGRPIKNIDPLGNVVQVQRDGAGNPLVITNQRGNTTSYEYDQRGLMVTRYEPNGGVTRFESDDHANLIRMETPKGGEWRWTWDYFGRVLSKTDPLGNTTRYRYTNSGRILELVQPDGTSIHYTYDGVGNVTSVRDEVGRLTRFEWGGYNWCYRKTLPDGATIEYRYNREGWLVWVANQLGETCTFEHDHTGLVVREVTFDGREHRYTYDAMGRLSGFENGAGEQTLLERDAVGRLTRIVYHDDSEDVFERDAAGRVVRVAGPDATIEYTYDAAGNVVGEATERRDGGRFGVTQHLDALGRWTRLETSLGLRIEADRDVLGDASRVRLGDTRAVEYERDVLGFTRRRRLPGKGAIETRYDSRFRVTERYVRSVTAGTHREEGPPEWLGQRPPDATFWRAYEYDTNDNPVREWGRSEGAVELEYDARSHLLARGNEEFRVDALSRHFPRQETRAYEGGGRITQAGGTTFEWDRAGQLIAKRKRDEDTGSTQEWRYLWNARRFLEAVSLPSGRQVRLRYDPFGRRVEKAVHASDAPNAALVSCVTYHWFGNRVLHEVTYDSAAVTPPRERQWVYEDGSLSPFALRDKTFDVGSVGLAGDAAFGPGGSSSLGGSSSPGGGWLFQVSTDNGFPEALVDAEGQVTNAFERGAFGKLTARDPRATTTTSRFEGQTADDECGLYYNRFRYYDPEAGTFISPDPFGLQAGENHYYYATNPISWIDPFGLWPHTCSCTLRDSNNQEWVPTSGMRRQRGSQLEPGFVSGWAEDPNFPERENTDHRSQATCHTERKAMEWAEANFSPQELDGAEMSLGGRYPPCPQCHKHMMEFSERTGCDVDYSWPANNRLTYSGGGANNSGGTNNGAALLNSYARNGNGTWVNYSQAQQTYRAQANALGPLGTF